MPIALNNKYFLGARSLAKNAGTEDIFNALQSRLIDFAHRIGCDRVGSSGLKPRGIPFRLKGRNEDLFAFWVERLADNVQGLAAISFDPERLTEELRPSFSALMTTLQHSTGYKLVKNKRYYSEAVGFVDANSGMLVLAEIDNFISAAFERLGLAAFAPYESAKQEKNKEHGEKTVSEWTSDAAPPGVDPTEWAQIVRRRGQKKFREALLRAYGGRCAISGCGVKAALEAAHITPYSETRAYNVEDGILLRADIHTLFDLHLITVDPSNLHVRVAESLKADYGECDEMPLRLPSNQNDKPSIESLANHFKRWAHLTDYALPFGSENADESARI